MNNLSWLRRVNSVKMTLLPRLLCLFPSLPIPIKKDHIKSFQSKLLKFTWGKAGYRIPQQTLYLHRKKEGLGLPHLHKYYLAARIAQMLVIYSKYTRLGANRKTGSTSIYPRLPALELPENLPPDFGHHPFSYFCPLGLFVFKLFSSVSI